MLREKSLFVGQFATSPLHIRQLPRQFNAIGTRLGQRAHCKLCEGLAGPSVGAAESGKKGT